MNKKVIFLTMTVLCAMYLCAQNNQSPNGYLNSQIAVLNKVQPLTSQQRQQFDSIYWVKVGEHGNMEVAFHEAMCGALIEAEYFKQYFNDQITKRAWMILNDDLTYFRQKQNLPEESLELIKPILQKRSMESAYCEFRFFTNSGKRAQAIAAVRDKYREQISTVTLKNNSSGASFNLGIVLKYREDLNLSEQQIDSIVAAAQKIRLLSKDGIITKEKNNRWEYERKYIMKFLDEEQLSKFLAIRNYDYAKSYAQKMWTEMENYDIAFEYDKDETINEIIVYQLNKEKIKYIYKDNPQLLNQMDSYLYTNSYPKALRHLRTEKRKSQNQDTTDQQELTF